MCFLAARYHITPHSAAQHPWARQGTRSLCFRALCLVLTSRGNPTNKNPPSNPNGHCVVRAMPGLLPNSRLFVIVITLVPLVCVNTCFSDSVTKSISLHGLTYFECFRQTTVLSHPLSSNRGSAGSFVDLDGSSVDGHSEQTPTNKHPPRHEHTHTHTDTHKVEEHTHPPTLFPFPWTANRMSKPSVLQQCYCSCSTGACERFTPRCSQWETDVDYYYRSRSVAGSTVPQVETPAVSVCRSAMIVSRGHLDDSQGIVGELL